MKLAQKIRRKLVYSIAVMSDRLFCALPRPLALFVGSWLGLAAYKIVTRDQIRIFRHLSVAYENSLSANEKISIGRTFYINSGRNIADLMRFSSLHPDEILKVVDCSGLRYFESAYIRGKGVLGITGHLGNFELLAAYLVKLGYKVGAIGRKLADLKLNNLLLEKRQKMGIVNFDASAPPQKIISWLRAGGAIGAVIDLDSARLRSVFLPAFGRPSKVPAGQSIIAARTGAALIPMVCIRTNLGRYQVIIKPEIPIKYTYNRGSKADICQTTLDCHNVLQELIDQYREQWIWMHNRWHTAPQAD
ncbi:MAG: lysophospholipid acyltransferase family protein [candidate division Zixibacteria bacterium]